MDYTIANENLTVSIRDLGAELCSIRSADGTEYLWQGDPAFWRGQSPNLFPYIGRLTDGKYTFAGETYEMKIHGIAKYLVFEAANQKEDSIDFILRSNEETKKQYPFDFVFTIRYALVEKKLQIEYLVQNLSGEPMFFGVGGHTGFNVPMEEGLSFEDYCVEFSKTAKPTKVVMTEDVHVSGVREDYPLEEGTKIPLHHDLFDHDAVVLENMDHTMTIRSASGKRAVRVSIPAFHYVGFWHAVKKEAPYVCIEPWSSLPSRSGVVEDFAQQGDLICLEGNATYRNPWTIEIL